MEGFIFPFNDQAALQHQDDAACAALYQDIWARISECDEIFSLPDLSGIKQSCSKLHWQARYGCVVMVRPLDSRNSSITVIGLDGWHSTVHASVHGRESTAVPDVSSPALYELGPYQTSSIDTLLMNFDAALTESGANNTGHRRGQLAGHQGNQKTPSFARTLLWQVMSGTKGSLQIQGGTTDVGLHTGCIRRNTSFPLVLSSFQTILRLEGEATDQIFYKCVAAYLMSFLQKAAPLIFQPRKIDRVMVIIREVEKYVLLVKDVGFKDAAVGVIEKHHARLLELRPGGDSGAISFQHDGVRNICKTLRAPIFPDLPDLSNSGDSQSQMVRAKSDARKNLGWSDILSSGFTGDLQDAWVQITKLNIFFWKIATELNDYGATYVIKDLRTKLAHFSKQVAVARTQSTQNTHVMTVVLSSSEFLAAWICFCWAHRAAETEHPLFLQFGAALDPNDLKHIALDDARAIEAVKRVRQFLQQRYQTSIKPFRKVEDTLKLALAYCKSSARLRGIHSKEREAADKHIDERWRKIKKTQAELVVLDRRLQQAKQELACAKARAESSRLVDYEWIDSGRSQRKIYTEVYRAFVRKRDACQATVNTLASQIATLENKPSNLTLGLPRSEERSWLWLFFLFMPLEFRNLSAIAQLAQSMLWTKAPNAESVTQNLLHWYASNRKVSSESCSEAEMILGSRSQTPRFSTPGIRSFSRETGVFFPDSLSVDPVWVGLDPFVSGHCENDTVNLFTERLPAWVDKSNFMQQFVAMLPTKVRENEGIACRDKKPEWLTQEHFVSFTTLRAGPYAQIRGLVEALQDDLLPFKHECVHILVKQLIFHVGEPAWKTDLGKEWDGVARIAAQMQRRVDLLRSSPKDCDQLAFFGIVSSFFGQYDGVCRACAVELASIARHWADDVVEKQMERDVEEVGRVSPTLYLKQAKMYGSALLCYGLGNLVDDDYLEIAELVVLFRSKMLFASEAPESKRLDQPVLQAMASRIVGLVGAIDRNLKHLTKCLSLLLDDVPLDLDWRSVIYDGVAETACFEAEADRHLYSINLLNGTVLVDGVPPGLLPSSVVEDPLYRRTFGERNFEMVVLGFRHYRASRRVDGRFLYEFMVDTADTLHILEHEAASPDECRTLLLLRNGKSDLPPLISETHSQWYSDKAQIVVLRDSSYLERRVKYVVSRAATYLIPLETQEVPLHKVLEKLSSCEQLVLGEADLVRRLEAFEHEKFVHLTVDAKRTALRVSLPRYKLSFVLQHRKIKSQQFSDFYMQDMRVLEDTLPGLKAFIVLAHPDGSEKVLISEGKIGPEASVCIPADWRVGMQYHIYNIHSRFGCLVAGDTIGRLHLAGLYASSACTVPDRRLGQPGSVVATELVRQSWKNEPLTDAEQWKLVEVVRHSNLSSTLSLICSWLWKSSNSLLFLYGRREAPRHSELDLDLLAQDEYRLNERFAPRLMPCEERSLLGSRQPLRKSVPLQKLQDSATFEFVHETESHMRSQHVLESRPKSKRGFPLDRPSRCSMLGRKFYDDIEDSYRKFSRLRSKKVATANSNFRTIEREVQKRRAAVEISILESLKAGDESSEHRLSQLSGRKLIAGPFDILRMLSDESIVALHNVHLDMDARVQLRADTFDWAILCVLEDKLRRIIQMAEDDEHGLLTELECVREWKPTCQPRWLAFEVEQQLQIRPNQYSIVKQLLEEPGSTIQLNMGLGKTRVLVPMLMLDTMPKDRIGRVCMLQSIAAEATEYYKTALVASSQNVKLFAMPFNRGIELDEIRALQLSDELARCKEHQGCFVSTPQHRNSLLLKQHDQDVFVEGLQESFVDILDESDALLSHDFQLVYALGEQVPLPSGPCRWTVLQALLTLLGRSENEDVLKFTNDPSFVHREQRCSGAFPKLRLLLPFKGHERELAKALCEELLVRPPHALKWMLQVPTADADVLVSLMSDPKARGVLGAIQSHSLFKLKQSDILAGRGFIAYGLLFHGLESRHRVKYGLNFDSASNMAVPYSASDTPKKRATFSHPDMELVYTALAYFHDGINESQLKDALELLQTMGPVAQQAIYSEWIECIRDEVAADEMALYDDILKVDVNNKLQLGLMHEKLGRCMDVISFWASNFVFVSETDQFLSRRATSAWNLCDSGDAVGFSGTDDNRFLLPLSITQIPPKDELLRATNGEMINRIFECTKNIHVLDDVSGPMAQEVLNQCLRLDVDALIDVAGLMAGYENCKAATYLAEKCGKRGVVFYDTNLGMWAVYETAHRRSMPLSSSALKEAECFVYFDESRCRGSDMKLLTNAVALVTLEPKMTKDKFLQGCARMRKLRPNGQSLRLAGASEVVSPNNSTVKMVLEKIMRNTTAAAQKGIPTYYQRGINYYSFPSPTKGDISLEAMYAGYLPDYADFSEFLDATHESEVLTEEVEELVEHCSNIGQGMPAAAMGQLAEECEQELEHEEEREEEEEIELPKQSAAAQEDWPFPEAFSNPEPLFKSLFLPLKDFVSSKISVLSPIPWPAKLYCTPNFWRTIQASAYSKDLSLYLRPVNAMLVLPDCRIVLVSAYELDKLLPTWWAVSNQRPKAILHHLTSCVTGQGFGRDSVPVPQEILTFVKLFRGYVQYSEPHQKKILLKALRCVPQPRQLVQQLLSMRSRLGFFDRSDLEAISSSLLR